MPCPTSLDWELDIEGLEGGDYRVLVYAPADGTPTGDLDVNGALLLSLPGDPGPGLTEGVSWDWTSAYLVGDTLTIQTVAPACTGIAGIQIEQAVPVPEPAGLFGLFAGIGLLAFLRTRRTPQQVDGSGARRARFRAGTRRYR